MNTKQNAFLPLLLALCLAVGLLSACGATPAANAPAPTEEAAEPPAPAGIPVAGKYFSVLFPMDWDGQFTTAESEGDGRYSLSVYHRASHEAEGSGHLFTLMLYPDMSFVSLPQYRALGVLSDGQQRLNLVAQFPSDVQAATDQFEAYFALYNEENFQRIFESLTPAAGWTLEPLDENALYNAQARFEYASHLSAFKSLNQLPDGAEILPAGWDGSIEDNRFAVCDVDGDGRMELLFSVENSYMAGCRTAVYRLDGFELQTEMVAFPVPTFYEQGVVRAFASHNHTHGEAWPYDLLRYNPDSQTYESVASVYSWDKAIADIDYDGAPFPDEVDADGNGTVYFVSEGENARWLDDGDFDAWEQANFGTLAELTIPWLSFTDANIASLMD